MTFCESQPSNRLLIAHLDSVVFTPVTQRRSKAFCDRTHTHMTADTAWRRKSVIESFLSVIRFNVKSCTNKRQRILYERLLFLFWFVRLHCIRNRSWGHPFSYGTGRAFSGSIGRERVISTDDDINTPTGRSVFLYRRLAEGGRLSN